ncbi:MAG: SpaA isopeptide-forming pilin-related protein, partial [Christensenellales bacterium]
DVKVGETQTSGADGMVLFEDLAPGDYTIKEVGPAPGYLLNTTPISVTVAEEAEGQPQTIELEDFINYKGSVQLKKTDILGVGLQGAQFEIYDGEDVKVGETQTSGEDGMVLFEGLAPGEYTIRETLAIDGYVRNTEGISVVIPDEFEGLPEVIDGGEMVNYLGSISLFKTDELDNPLRGAEFELYDADGEQIGEAQTSDGDGRVLFAHLAPGEYTIIETQAAPGYILNTQPIEVTVLAEAEGVPQATMEQAVNYQGKVMLIKLDSSDPDGRLEGAVFELIQQSSGKVLKTGLGTDSNGELLVEGLAPGTYAFRETQAPKDYELSDAVYFFEITDRTAGEPELIEIVVTNEKIASFTDETDGKATKTGYENVQMTLLIGVMAAGLAACVAILLVKRNRNRRDAS